MVYRCIEDKINIKNAAVLFSFSQLFSSSNLSKPPLHFFERCFPMLVDSSSFLELNFKNISKILSSSELNIDSEMEVFSAIFSWLGHKKERKIYAKDLVLKVRLSLLSDPALKLITENISCFIDDSTFINDVTIEKNNKPRSKRSKNISRHCTHNSFNIVFSGGTLSSIYSDSVVNDVCIVEACDLKTVRKLPKLKKGRQWHEALCIKGEILVLGGVDNDLNTITSI